MFDFTEIDARAEKPSIERGKTLFAKGAVSRLSIKGDTATATVSGQQSYTVSLTQGAPISNHCSCPAADYQDVCKHCVAVAIAANAAQEGELVEDDSTKLRQLLSQKPSEELVELLLNFIRDDEVEWQKWQTKIQLMEGTISLADLRKKVTKALPSRDIWNWHEVGSYFTQAEIHFSVIWLAMDALKPDEQWKLMGHIVKRLGKILQRVDDSCGYRFELEGQINQKMPLIFDRLDWSPSEKAHWLFDQIDNTEFDCFPPLDHFSINEQVEPLFLALCQQKLEPLVEQGILTDFDSAWRAQNYAEPLLRHAISHNNWREQVRLLALLARRHSDYLDISNLCLKHDEEFEAEDWLIRAKKVAVTDYEKNQCLQHEVKVRMALGENDAAWRLAWRLFNETPSFESFKETEALHDELGQPEADFINKAETILIGCYQPPKNGYLPHDADAALAFYLDKNRFDDARQWVKTHKAEPEQLIKLADHIMGEHLLESVVLYQRVVIGIIERTSNSAYQEAIELLMSFEQLIHQHRLDLAPFNALVTELATTFKRKRNMMALFKQHFSGCL